MKQYLDITSLINSDYYKKNTRLKWHISQLKYDELAQDIYDLLKNINLSKQEEEILNISTTSIHHNLCSYLSHVYDYVVLQEQNIKPIYSSSSNIYIDNIWNNKPLDKIFSIELEKKRFKKTKLKSIYSYLFKYIPKKKYNYILASKNQLVNEFVEKNKNTFLQISPPYHFDIDTTSSIFSKNLATKLNILIIENIEKKYFILNEEHKQSIKFILDTFISRAYNNLNSYNGFLKDSKNIITGTGYNYYNRLLSTIAEKESIKMTRFYHGGDRCFYNDTWYWDSEYLQIDTFITYGTKWANFARKKALELNKKIEVKAIGSKYHQKLYDKFFDKKINNKNKILYIPNAFIGEARQFPYAKIIDPLLFDWQKYLIEILQKNGFEVIYKKHPKGFFQEENILGKIAKYESTKPMIEALEDADMVLCDMAGSAFVESLCAGKEIVLIDTKQRLFNIETKKDLEKAVKIIDAYWDDNILCIDKDMLVKTFKNLNINSDDKRKVVKDYFIEGEIDV